MTHHNKNIILIYSKTIYIPIVYKRMDDNMNDVKIITKQQRMKTAPNLYGIFLEDINRAVDGGLYPELIRNRSFEDSLLPKECRVVDAGYAFESASGWRDEFNGGEGLSRWVRDNQIEKTKIPGWYVENAEMELDGTETLNRNRQVSLKVSFDPNGILRNIGFCGIPQIKKEEYHFYMFARSSEPMDVGISVRDKNGVEEYGSVRVLHDTFTRYDLDHAAQRFMEEGRLELTCKSGGELRIGFISLMPKNTFNGHGFRKDIMEKLKDISPKFFRFPGGCVVEGFTVSTAMRFANTIGPVWERPGRQLMWHYRSYDGIGFHEYLQLCEDLAMEPLYVCNCGMTCQARNEVLMEGSAQDEMLQDTLDAIEYATGSKDTKWGMFRATMGHPEPFKLNYIEIGNENWGPAYEERYKRWYEAIHAKYPHITCIANSHLEKKRLPAPVVDEHYYDTAEFFTENTNFFNRYNRKGPKIFLGEISVVRGYTAQLYGALAEAAYFTGVEKNQDIVTMVSYAPLLENVKYQSWFPNLIRFDNHRSMGIPSYYVWKMFGSNRGDYVVKEDTKTGRIVRPVKGIASFHGKPGMRCKEPVWNGQPVELTHEVMGHFGLSDGIREVTAPDKGQKEEAARHYGARLDEVLLVFGEEQPQSGRFEVQVCTEAGRTYEFGAFPYRLPEQTYVSDETHPPKPWNVENVKPFIWKISCMKSEVYDTMGGGPNPKKLRCVKEKLWETEGWHTFSWETDLKEIRFYVDNTLVHEVVIPSSPVINCVATATDSEIILKLVNLAESTEPVKIRLDCKVEDDYNVTRFFGEKTAMNTLEEPENVRDYEETLTGAAKCFIYEAPALSVNVLRLRKK